MRFFLAHSKREGEDNEVLAKILARVRRIVSEEHELVLARDDFLANIDAEGGWDGWCRSISCRIDPDTGVKVYDGIVVPASRVGKATAAIVRSALEAGVDVFVVGEDGFDWSVSGVSEVDRRDYLTGWALEGGE